MSILRPLLRAFAVSSLLVVVPFAAARAADPADVAKRFKDVFAARGTDLQWKAVSGDDASMVLSGVTVGVAGEERRTDIGDVTLTGVSEDNGAYVIGKTTLPAYHVEQPGTAVSMTGLSISGLRLPPPDSTDPMKSLLMYDKAEIADLSVEREGRQVFDLSNFHVDVTRPEGDSPLKFNGTAESFKADLSGTREPRLKAAIKALGYENIDGNLAVAGSWAPKTGEASLDTYRLTVKNAGTLYISCKAGAVTPEFVRSMKAIRARIADAPQDQKRPLRASMAELLGQLTFGGASIAFQDDSLTGKVLDYVAAEQGIDRAQLVARAKQTLPLALMALNDPETAAEAAGAVSAFLDDPKNLTIRAEPPNPIAIRDLVGSPPLQLPQILGLKIEANK